MNPVNINSLSDDLLRLVFSELPISSIKAVLCTSRRWNRSVDHSFVWSKIAAKLPIPSKMCKRIFKYCPEWKIYNEAGIIKEKIKHFLINSRTVFLFISNETLENEYGKPFSYQTVASGLVFYPEALWPESISIETLEISTYYPFLREIDPIIPVRCLNREGQSVGCFPNRVQYFYLLDCKEGDSLFWIINKTFYRVICSQQPSFQNELKEIKFEQIVEEKVKSFIEKKFITPLIIKGKKKHLKEIHLFIDFIAENYDKRWLLLT